MRRVEYKYIVASVFVVGLFMDLLDSTITNVALPGLAHDFHASTTTISWVVTGYLLSLAIFIPASGWAGDRFGTKRTFTFALAIFVGASFLCGVAWSTESLIGFRVLQGVGGGMLTPVGTTMLFRVFPPSERARASSLLAVPAVLAPATGPVLGGYLVQYVSWRWIFFVNIPVGLIGLVLAVLFLKEQREDESGRFDVPGFIFSASGLALVVYALAQAGTYGFGDVRVALPGVVGLAALVAFTIVELRTPQPMLDVRLFRDRLFTASNLVQFVSQAGMAGVFFLLPLFLQLERGLGPLQSGLTTFPMALGVIMMMPIAGQVYMRVGPRRMTMAGLAVIVLSTAALCLVDLQTDLWWIRLMMLARGWGFAFTLIPMQTATFATIRSEDTGRASAAFNSVQRVAGSFGVALLATVLAGRLTAHGAALGSARTQAGAVFAFHDGFFIGAMLCVVGIGVALLVDDKLAAGTMRRREVSAEPLVAAAPAD